MNLAALFALLLQSGACAPVEFKGQDGSGLTVLVCPMLRPSAEPSPEIPEQPKTPAHRT